MLNDDWLILGLVLLLPGSLDGFRLQVNAFQRGLRLPFHPVRFAVATDLQYPEV